MAKSSIIEESKKAKGQGFFKKIFNKKILIILVVLLALGGTAYYFYSKKTQTVATVIKQNTLVKKENLQIAVQSDGKVVAKDGVVLSFSNSASTAEVNAVYVKEGAQVKKGDKIASIKTDSLEFDLRNAYSNYQSALANLQLKEAGATATDRAKAQNAIDQAKLSLDQSKISLAQTQSSSEQSIRNAENNVLVAENNLKLNADEKSSAIVNDAYDNLNNSLKSINISLAKSLQDLDSILGVDNQSLNDVFENLLGVKNSGVYSTAKDNYLIAKINNNNFNSAFSAINNGSSQLDIDNASSKAEVAINSMEKVLSGTRSTLEATITSSSFSQNQLDSLISKIDSARSSMASLDSALTGSFQSIANAKRSLASFQLSYQKAQDDLVSAKTTAAQNIANANNNVANRVASLQSAQISYNALVAPATKADLASSRAQLTSASINVDKAKYNVDQATLISPIDGVVSQLNYKQGDIVTDNTKSMATIINNNTLYIEANIEESDVSKIKVGQKARATFDAVDGLSLDGEVSFISMTSLTSSNGIVTYLVRVIFSSPKDSPIREGMTASVNFITAEALNVLTVPVDAVRNVNGKSSVETADNIFTPVTTGFTDGKKVEIISGLNLGDKVLY